MRLATIRTGGATRAVRVDDEAAVETGHRCVGELLKEADWRGVAAAAAGPAHAVDSLDFATLVTWPEKTICVGLNYLDHIAETGRTPPEYPTLFTKYARSLIGAHDPIQMPRDDESTEIDWEAELGVVIGTRDPARIERSGGGGDRRLHRRQRRQRPRLPVPHHAVPAGQGMGGQHAGRSIPGHDRAGRAGRVPDQLHRRRSGDAGLEHVGVVLRAGRARAVHLDHDHARSRRPDRHWNTSRCGSCPQPEGVPERGQTVVTRIEGIGECRNVCA